MVKKIDGGEDLTEEELKKIVWNYEIDMIEVDEKRWTMMIESILEMCGRNFCLVWERGLTESQENEFYYQPYEVEKEEHQEMITVTNWNRKYIK